MEGMQVRCKLIVSRQVQSPWDQGLFSSQNCPEYGCDYAEECHHLGILAHPEKLNDFNVDEIFAEGGGDLQLRRSGLGRGARHLGLLLGADYFPRRGVYRGLRPAFRIKARTRTGLGPAHPDIPLLCATAF